MKRSRNPKLALRRETVRNLEQGSLRSAVGGTVVYIPGTAFQLTDSGNPPFVLTQPYTAFPLGDDNPAIEFPG